MRRALLALAIIAFTLAAVVWAFQPTRFRPARSSVLSSMGGTAQLALTNPVVFVKRQVTGGIGALIGTDPATGLPFVGGVKRGSPAERAGLRDGDVITDINGVAIRGKPLPQVLQMIQGISFGKVTLTVQRSGATNVQCVLHRSSWNRLDRLGY